MTAAPRRPPNDLAQYEDLSGEWWNPRGAFAALHWLARSRARLVPPPRRPGAALLDLGCGGGLLAPHISGYRHVGVDLSPSALTLAAAAGIEPVQADITALPFADRSFDVVVAGEVLEHVDDLDAVVGEALRVLADGGTFVCDTINATWFARLSLVTIGERIAGGPPPGCHDPRLFVPPRRLQELCARHGVALRVEGVRPSVREYLGFLIGRRTTVHMVATRSLAATYQGVGLRGASVGA
jgi:2-polyprenyl-6-hydroxyphenyl methylase/3-demethylubiquinone-9 3-methyltransferase